METLTPYLLVSGLVKVMVDRLRVWFPMLDGVVVNLVALALGYAATYVPEVIVDDTLTSWSARLAAAAVIAGLSGVFADWSYRSDPPTVGV